MVSILQTLPSVENALCNLNSFNVQKTFLFYDKWAKSLDVIVTSAYSNKKVVVKM